MAFDSRDFRDTILANIHNAGKNPDVNKIFSDFRPNDAPTQQFLKDLYGITGGGENGGYTAIDYPYLENILKKQKSIRRDDIMTAAGRYDISERLGAKSPAWLNGKIDAQAVDNILKSATADDISDARRALDYIGDASKEEQEEAIKALSGSKISDLASLQTASVEISNIRGTNFNRYKDSQNVLGEADENGVRNFLSGEDVYNNAQKNRDTRVFDKPETRKNFIDDWNNRYRDGREAIADPLNKDRYFFTDKGNTADQLANGKTATYKDSNSLADVKIKGQATVKDYYTGTKDTYKTVDWNAKIGRKKIYNSESVYDENGTEVGKKGKLQAEKDWKDAWNEDSSEFNINQGKTEFDYENTARRLEQDFDQTVDEKLADWKSKQTTNVDEKKLNDQKIKIREGERAGLKTRLETADTAFRSQIANTAYTDTQQDAIATLLRTERNGKTMFGSSGQILNTKYVKTDVANLTDAYDILEGSGESGKKLIEQWNSVGLTKDVMIAEGKLGGTNLGLAKGQVEGLVANAVETTGKTGIAAIDEVAKRAGTGEINAEARKLMSENSAKIAKGMSGWGIGGVAKYALGATLIYGAYAAFNNKGQQSNAQLYGQQPNY